MSNETILRAYPAQRDFILCPAYYVGFVGGRGTGASVLPDGKPMILMNSVSGEVISRLGHLSYLPRLPGRLQKFYLPSVMGTSVVLAGEPTAWGTSMRRKPFWYAALAWFKSKPGGISKTHSKGP